MKAYCEPGQALHGVLHFRNNTVSWVLLISIYSRGNGESGSLQYPLKSRGKKPCYHNSCILCACKISTVWTLPKFMAWAFWSDGLSSTWTHLSYGWGSQGALHPMWGAATQGSSGQRVYGGCPWHHPLQIILPTSSFEPVMRGADLKISQMFLGSFSHCLDDLLSPHSSS